MDQAAVDKMLKRRLNLQRYVSSLTGDVLAMLDTGDREMRIKLSDFIEDSTERSRAAFGNQRSSDESAKILLADLKGIIQIQRDTTNVYLASEMKELIDKELEHTADVMGVEPPSAVGVASTPISGQTQTAIIAGAFALYAQRMISEVTQTMMTAPDTVLRLIRGTRAENFNNGLIAWRRNRLIAPNIDVIVNGTASNAASRVYARNRVERVDYVATLDFRTCVRCRAAEDGSSYRLGEEPRVPQHPRCRCLHLPEQINQNSERPYVEDDRSVSQIPRSERGERIGRTRDSIEQFFSRMTNQDRVDYMGPARAQLWKDGKITDVQQLVSQITGEPLRLNQLPQ